MPHSDVDDSASCAPSFTTDASDGAHGPRRGAKKYKWHKRFAYQKFVGWRPILTPRIAELFFLSAGVLLLALGIPVLIASLNVVEVRVPYAFEGPFTSGAQQANQETLWAQQAASANGDGGVQYTVSVLIPKDMEPPIYVAYELSTYFQNFRRYARSYDPTRMHDGSSSGSPVSACNPFSYLGDNNSFPINPCGQIAQSFFNDTFSFAVADEGSLQPVAVDSSSIAWSSDADNLYGAVPAENYNPGGAAAPLRGGNTSDVVLNANQHWMVWMRPHSQVAAQKLWGSINVPLEAGTNLTIAVTNRYNTYNYNGAKTIILSTNSWVGGRNNFLGACYIAVGGLSLLMALFFFLGYDLGLIWKRQYGDMVNVSWLREAGKEVQQQQDDMRAAASSTGKADGAAVQDDAASEDQSQQRSPPFRQQAGGGGRAPDAV
ncbi:ALA-interacting subunit 3 isoform A [Chlorella sorokiniana]|uniref:ALA-interacting subunit 3 isoform A n=1 Tax=Chlorella sorokiniana TaxID=3076 RepID=A0A2P6TNQ6_CHLSO|nr:ALA-interacting subunit 3 isoform A [Chlorella sorokiniana]|eukprot:PRW50939.1 ALA-interacting subunit 3 isoform A [Chlorella sorokiniana]